MNSNRNLLQNCNLPTLTLEFDSDSVTCPNKAKSPKDFHSCNRAGLWRPPFTLLDVYEGAPVQVNVRVQKWRCTCGKEFSDPSNPYHGKSKTTKSFRDFIAQKLLSDSKLTEEEIATKYGISVKIVSQALSDYMKDCKFVFGKKAICDQILVKDIFYKGTERLLIFARFRKEEPVQLIGISDTVSRPEVMKYISSSYRPAEIVCSSRIIDDIFELGDADVLTPNTPTDLEIQRICTIINEFQVRNISYESMKFRLFFQSKYRREEVRDAGLGDSLPYRFSQIAAPLKSHLCIVKRVYFDIDEFYWDYLKGKLF